MTTDKEAAEAFEEWRDLQLGFDDWRKETCGREAWLRAVEWATNRERERLIAIIRTVRQTLPAVAEIGFITGMREACDDIERRIAEG